MSYRGARWLRRPGILLMLALVLVVTTQGIGSGSAAPGAPTTYVVVYTEGVSLAVAHAALDAAGGTLVEENTAIGVATISTTNAAFMAAAMQQPALSGVARNVPVGMATPDGNAAPAKSGIETWTTGEASAQQAHATTANSMAASTGEPLSNLQWDMRMMHATTSGSYARQRGIRTVKVGIIDTGVDGAHPDIAPNFSNDLSRNFTTDIPDVDGPCEYADCKDPVNVDNAGHGTHVAGTIGAAINGFGIAGVAPNVTLVNIRAGQDSGFFFLQPVVDALTYAGDAGIDVVNMSFYIDPWLYNCSDNPADSPEAQLEQRTIITATQRALAYANGKGVTLIVAEGNEYTDLGHPQFDNGPDYPIGSGYSRTVDNSCLTMPQEGPYVIDIASVGPSGRKAYYSNYGLEQTDFAAPGGDRFDGGDDATHEILSTYPENVAQANGELNPDGTPNTPFVVRECRNGTCAYYRWYQGTSMAAPHATGVVALIISQYGSTAASLKRSGLLTWAVQRSLAKAAAPHACPNPRLFDYPAPISPDHDAYCEGTGTRNGFYGAGILDALRAVTYGGRP